MEQRVQQLDIADPDAPKAEGHNSGYVIVGVACVDLVPSVVLCLCWIIYILLYACRDGQVQGNGQMIEPQTSLTEDDIEKASIDSAII